MATSKATSTGKAAVQDREVAAPADLMQALKAEPKVLAIWQDLTPIARRDFISWVESAKQEKTRQGRIEKAVSKLASGQRRPCCYSIMPLDLHNALKANPAAKATWGEVNATERRDFLDWVEESGKGEPRKARIDEAVALLMAGKHGP